MTNQPVNITITGFANKIEYKINNSEWKLYKGAFDNLEVGTIQARFVNKAGKVIDTINLQINNIDTTPPTAPIFGSISKKVTNQPISISIASADTSSKIEYSLDDKEWKEYKEAIEIKENGKVYARNVDLAGNYSTETIASIDSIDTTAPDAPAISSDNTQPTKSGVNISVASSNTDIDKIEYKLGDNGWQTYSKPIPIASNLTIYARAYDIAGNISSESTLPIQNIVEKKSVEEISKFITSVVQIKIFNINDILIATGSGFVAQEGGIIITNYHVIDFAYRAEVVTSDGKSYKVNEILNYDVAKDIAILKVNDLPAIKPVTLGIDVPVTIGEAVVAIGSPLGIQNSISSGIISNKDISIGRKDMKDIQTTAAISHGSSGGVLLNMYGEALGITYAGMSSGQNINFVIPINDVRDMITQTNHYSLDDVFKNIYAKDKDYDTIIEDYLYDIYCEETADKYNFKFEASDVYPSKNVSNRICLDLYFYPDDFSTVYDAYSNNNKALVEKWVSKIVNEMKYFYKDKNVSVYLVYFGKFKTRPSGFQDYEVIYDSKEQVYVVLSLIAQDVYENGKETFTW